MKRPAFAEIIGAYCRCTHLQELHQPACQKQSCDCEAFKTLPRWQRRASYRGMRHKNPEDIKPSPRLDISGMPCGFCSQVHDPSLWPCPVGVLDGKAVTMGHEG